MPEIVEVIRPKLRSDFFCGGFCTSTNWIMSALAEAYPYKKWQSLLGIEVTVTGIPPPPESDED